jgi:hypothetical protein
MCAFPRRLKCRRNEIQILKLMKREHSAILARASLICVFGVINSPAAVHYVNVNGTNPIPPYTTWVMAATNIQDAVNAAAAGDEVVVTNGVYPGGILVSNPLALRSVNGPRFTAINAGGTNRCAYLADGASLTGLTLTNGQAYRGLGGGVYSASTNAFLTNCVLMANSARIGGGACGVALYNCTLSDNSAAGYSYVVQGWTYYMPGMGGGASSCILHNCTLTSNSAALAFPSGGGAHGSTLYNCTLTGNWALYAGGACQSTLNNCILCFNTTITGPDYDTTSVLNYCCATPMPTNGVGNITNEPAFVNGAAGDFHLQTNSPCINAGNNGYVITTTDLDGNPRIAGGTVDMGAYEFQPCITGGQFCDAACSPLAEFSFTFIGAIVGQPYRIQTSTNLAAGSWSDLTNLIYTGPTIITDPSALAGPKKFYRAVSP